MRRAVLVAQHDAIHAEREEAQQGEREFLERSRAAARAWRDSVRARRSGASGGIRGRMRDGSNCCTSRGLRLHGARGYAQRPPWLLPTAALLILLIYSRGKTGAVLAVMLGWLSFFPQAPPINGRC